MLDVDYAHRAQAMLLEHFDHEFACYSTIAPQVALLDTAASLGRLEEETAQALALADRYENRHSRSISLVFRQLARSLRGKTVAPGSFDDDEFDEQEHLRSVEHNGMARALYLIYRGLAAALFDDWALCLDLVEQARSALPYIGGFYPTALCNFLHSFCLCRRMQETSTTEEERASVFRQLAANQAWLSRRALDARSNFLHLFKLIEAERQVDDAPAEAAKNFEDSITLAGREARSWHLAFACQCAARYYRRGGIHVAAEAYQRKAEAAYASWGATAKGRSATNRAIRPPSVWDPEAFPSPGIFDLEAVMQASQVLAGDLRLESLVPKVMQIVLTTAGADRAVLLRGSDGDQLTAIGMSDADQTGVHVVSPPLDPAEVDLPYQILNLARRTGEALLVNEAIATRSFGTSRTCSASNRNPSCAYRLSAAGSALACCIWKIASSAAPFRKNGYACFEPWPRRLRSPSKTPNCIIARRMSWLSASASRKSCLR